MREERRTAVGGFLDELPTGLYVVAHVVFLGVGVALWAHVRATAFPHPAALLLYVVSQAVFLGFFANWITFKMAVLAEQTLMLAMMCVIAIGVL